MANIKISALPTSAVTTANDYFVMDDAALSTTSKIQLKNFAGLTNDTGSNSIRSAEWLGSTDTRATGDDSVAIGNGASGTTQSGIAIGRNAEATSPYSIAIGDGAYNTNRDGNREYYIAIGYQAQSVQNGVSIGRESNNGANEGVAIGRQALVNGNNSISIGYDSRSQGANSVTLGNQVYTNGGEAVNIGVYSQVNGSYGGSIGATNTVNQIYSFVMAYNKTDIYESTSHFQNVYSYGQITQAVQTFTGDTFSIDFYNGGAVELFLTGDSTCSLTNVRPGSRYIIKVTTTGAQTLTPSASGYSFIYEGGGFSLTNNGTDICILDVWPNGIISISHFADFS